MKKKVDGKREKEVTITLTPEESLELEILLDRISVQVPDGESFQVYLTTLCKTLEGREGLVAALLSRLGKNPTQAGFRVCQALQGLISNRSYRKELRRVAYRFAQKGYAVEQGSDAPERVVLVQKEQKKALAHMVLGHGTLWFLAALVPEEGLGWPTAVTAYLDSSPENLQVRVTESSTKLYRDFIGKIAGTPSGGMPQEIPIEHAARLFFEMLEFSKAAFAGTPVVERASRLLRPFYNPETPPYACAIMPAQPEMALRDVPVGMLIDEADIQWLYFDKEELEPFYPRFIEAGESLLVIPEAMKEERGREVLRSAADALCIGKVRRLLQRFFEEHAAYWKLRGLEKPAQAAWAVARHLAEGGRPRDNPFVVALVLASISYHWPEEDESEEKPAHEEPFYRTEAGLFMPR